MHAIRGEHHGCLDLYVLSVVSSVLFRFLLFSGFEERLFAYKPQVCLLVHAATLSVLL